MFVFFNIVPNTYKNCEETTVVFFLWFWNMSCNTKKTAKLSSLWQIYIKQSQYQCISIGTENHRLCVEILAYVHGNNYGKAFFNNLDLHSVCNQVANKHCLCSPQSWWKYRWRCCIDFHSKFGSFQSTGLHSLQPCKCSGIKVIYTILSYVWLT